MARLGDICEVLNGYAFKSENYTSSGVRIIRIANVQKGYIEDTAPAFYPIDTTDIEKYTLYEDDLLISLTGNVGRVALLKKEFLPAALNQRVACLRLKDSAQYDKSFLYCFLNSDYFENKCIQSAKGVAQKNMSTEWLKEYQIPNLSLVEQKEIAAVLNKISELISARTMQLQKLDELVKSRFVEMFGDSEFNTMQWPTKKLSEICAVSSSKRIYQNELSTEGVPFLRISDLNERIDNAKNVPELFIPINKYNELKENGLVPTEGDILVTSRGTLGRCYIVRSEDEFYFQDGMISWLSDLNSQITSVYLSQLFAMSGIQKQIASLQAGSTVAYLSITMLKKLNIMLPPLDRQEQFAAFVKQTDKSKLAIQQSLEKLETLKKALMQQYFG